MGGEPFILNEDLFKDESPVAPTEDWKAKYEELSIKNEKGVKEYQNIQSQRDQLSHALASVKGAVESSKIGKFDEAYNLELYVNNINNQAKEANESYDEQEKDIDSSISELNKQRDDIDPQEYAEKIADLKAEKKALLMQKKFDEQLRDRDKKEAEKELTKETKQKFGAMVMMANQKYPGHNQPGHPLHTKMAEIMTKKAHIYGGVDLTKEENIRFRMALAEEANSQLEKSTGSDKEEIDQAALNQFSTLDNDQPYQSKEGSSGLNETQKTMVIGSGITDKKVLSQVNKIAAKINNGEAVYLED